MSFSPANVVQAGRAAVVEMERLYGVRVVHAAVSPNVDSHERAMQGGADFGFRVAFVRAPAVYLGTNSSLQNDKGFRRLDGALTGVGLMALDVREAFAGALRDPRMLGVAALSPWVDHFQSDVLVTNDTFSGLLGRVAGAGPVTRAALIDGLDAQISHLNDCLDSGDLRNGVTSTALARIYGMHVIKHGLLAGAITTPKELHIPDGLFPVGLDFDTLRRGADQHEMGALREHLRGVGALIHRSAAMAPNAAVGVSGLASLQFGAVAQQEGPAQIAAAIDGDVASLIHDAPAASLALQATGSRAGVEHASAQQVMPQPIPGYAPATTHVEAPVARGPGA